MTVQRLHESNIVRVGPVPDYWSSSGLTNQTVSSSLDYITLYINLVFPNKYCYVKCSVPHQNVTKKRKKKNKLAWSPSQFWGIGRTRKLCMALQAVNKQTKK